MKEEFIFGMIVGGGIILLLGIIYDIIELYRIIKIQNMDDDYE